MTAPKEPVESGLWVTTDPPEVAATMKERISTLLSTVAMLAMAGGVGWGLWPHLGPWAVAIAGLLLALMVSFADHARKTPDVDEAEPPPKPSKPVPPGPTDPGNLHTKGPGSRR